MCCTNLFRTLYTCERDICFLLSKVNNQSHLISKSHMLYRHHHKYKRI